MFSKTYVADIISVIDGNVVVTGSKCVEVGLFVSAASAFYVMVGSLAVGTSFINFRRVS